MKRDRPRELRLGCALSRPAPRYRSTTGAHGHGNNPRRDPDRPSRVLRMSAYIQVHFFGLSKFSRSENGL